MNLISLLMSLLLFIPYHLALVYIGVSIKFKDTIIPSVLLGVVAYTSKIIFTAPPILHTVIIVLACSFFLYLINKINLLLSIIGSLLSFTTLTLGSLLIACPFLVKIGFQISNETSGIQWIYLNFAEFSIPTLVLVIFKITKISPAKYIE